MTELTEKQFDILKTMCENDVRLIFAPHTEDGDPVDKVENYAKVRADLQNILDNGFMKDITSSFKDLLDDANKKGLRTFDVFCLTDEAYLMFNPKEGMVN